MHVQRSGNNAMVDMWLQLSVADQLSIAVNYNNIQKKKYITLFILLMFRSTQEVQLKSNVT